MNSSDLGLEEALDITQMTTLTNLDKNQKQSRNRGGMGTGPWDLKSDAVIAERRRQEPPAMWPPRRDIEHMAPLGHNELQTQDGITQQSHRLTLTKRELRSNNIYYLARWAPMKIFTITRVHSALYWLVLLNELSGQFKISIEPFVIITGWPVNYNRSDQLRFKKTWTSPESCLSGPVHGSCQFKTMNSALFFFNSNYLKLIKF